MLKVLMLVNYFPPEIGSGPHLPFELGETLVQRGCQVTVMTGFPQYNLPVIPQKYRGKLFYREELGGMTILRARSAPYGKGRLSRGLFHFLAPSTLATRAIFQKPPDIVYTCTPPLPMGIVARCVASRFGVPCIVHVQDLFPQNVIDLGMLRNRNISHFFETMERHVYRKADAIVVMSEGNVDHVVARGAHREKIRVVCNWVDTDLIKPEERMNGFRRTHQIGDEFVVVFAGTMGWSQGLEVVIQAARRLAAEPGLLFLLVGSGVKREELEHQAVGLPNVRFLPMQSKDVYPQVLAASDGCLVTLVPEVATPAVPSKIPTIMAAGRPILACLPRGDASRLIQESGSGLVVAAGAADELASAILELKSQPLLAKRLRDNGREYAVRRLSRAACVGDIEEMMRNLSKTNGRSAGNHDGLN